MCEKVPCTGCGRAMKSTTQTPMCHPCRRAQPKPPPPTRQWNCQVCGVLVHRAKGPTGLYCKRHKRYSETPCETCGTVTLRPHDTRFCSDQCRPIKQTSAPRTDLQWKTCAHCGQWISKPGRKHCDATCSREASRTAQGCRNRKCKQCKRPLGYFSTKHLCDECRTSNRKARRRTDRKTPRHRSQNNHRQRARHYGVEYEPVNPLKVYTRDRWRCGICRKRVDKRLKYPHLMSASLDHIEPMSAGGGHTYVNTQCSHWICNTRKSSHGIGDQLALIG